MKTIKVILKVGNFSNPYERIVREHLRYAGLVDIEEQLNVYPDELARREKAPIIELAVFIPKLRAEALIERMKSFGDNGEIEKSRRKGDER